MASFVIQFASPEGKLIRETVEAASEAAAVARIEAGGFTPISVCTAGSAGAGKPAARAPGLRRGRGGRGMRRALLDFTHQLCAVAESGIPIIAGLKAVGQQTAHPVLRSAIGRMIGRIEGGRSLADAMDPEMDIFSTLYVKTIAAGEAAGKVPEVLAALARYQEQEAETRGQIRSALMYPMLVVFALVVAIVFMLVFVVPQFAEMFAKFNGQLPLPTRILMAVSDSIRHQYLFVVLGLAAAVWGVRHVLRQPAGRTKWDELVLRLPVFGNLLVGIYMVRFVELLDLLMQAALPIVQSLRVTADSMTNEAIRKDVRGMIRSVEGGRSLTDAFLETRWLTPLVKRMLAIGEQAGRTDQVFSYLKKYYSTQTQRGVKLLSTLIEPALVTGLAAVVLFFALSIFLPMWKLLKLVGAG